MIQQANDKAVPAVKKCKICGKPLKSGGEIGPICAAHSGRMEKFYVKRSGDPHPDEFISLEELCDMAQASGHTRYWMVKLTGGNGGVNPPSSPEFTIYTFKKRGTYKYCKRSAIEKLHEITRCIKE